MHRFRFILYRPLQLIPVLFGISLVTFILVHLIPGDPAKILLGVRGSAEAVAEIHRRYGLDRPIFLQYLYFLVNLLQGQFGLSIIYRAPVLLVVATPIPPPVFLLAYAVLLSILLAVPFASLAAASRGGLADQVIRLFSTIGLGLPAFWMGIMLIMLLSLRLGWFP